MSNLSTSIFAASVAAIGVFTLSWAGVFAGPCERPVAYRIGSIDERFNISTTTARELLSEAEAVWEQKVNDEKELFTYDPSADFTIDFIFDERQQTTNKVNEYESTLTDLGLSHDEIISAYEEAKAEYDRAVASYQEQKNRYDADLADYNEQVQRWNDRGGAPRGVHQDLMDERQRLYDELDDLQVQQSEIEELRQQVNELASQGNLVAREYNETASTFASRFGESREFNQATYVGDAINVYQFEAEDDLRLALTHEFGHALGLGHVSDPESIMYYLMEDQPLDDLSLSDQDVKALDNLCSDDI